MKHLKQFLLVLSMVMTGCITANAEDYEVEKDGERSYGASWYPRLKGLNNESIGTVRTVFSYDIQSGYVVFFVRGSKEAKWISQLARRIVNNDKQMPGISVSITLSNGTTVSTTKTVALVNDLVAMIASRNVDVQLLWFTLGIYPQSCSISGEAPSNSIARFFTLLRTYDITSITIDGNTIKLSNTNSAYHIDNMMNEIAKKFGYHENMGKKEQPSNVTFKPIKVDHNVYRNGQKGMVIKASFDTTGIKGVNCELVAYFYFANGTALNNYNNSYGTVDNKVSSSTKITPGYDNTTYTDVEIFMPYDELHLSQQSGTKYELKFFLRLYDLESNKFIGNVCSDYCYFNLTY